MATFTPRFNFRLPERGLLGAPDDVVSAQFDAANNFSTVDTFTSVQVCTSLTRPVNPIASTLILETDTGKVLRWSGTSWIVMGTPLGPLGPVAPAALSTVNVAVSSIICPITFTTPAANRIYAFSFIVHGEHVAPAGVSVDGVYVNIRWASGGTVTTTDTALNASNFPGQTGAAVGNRSKAIGYFVANIPFAGQVTVGLEVFLQGNVRVEGNATDKISYLAIRDIGGT